jgi:hypothetical protein
MIYFVFLLVFKVKVVKIIDVNIISAPPRNPLDIMTDVFGHIVNNFEKTDQVVSSHLGIGTQHQKFNKSACTKKESLSGKKHKKE